MFTAEELVTGKIILIDKPLRWTSFDVVKKLKKPLLEEYRMQFPEAERKTIKRFKVGHAGTLDPLESGFFTARLKVDLLGFFN